MRTIALAGDSIFDNGAYVPGEKALAQQLSDISGDLKVELLAVDGSITSEVLRQIKKVSKGTDCLVISSGGNDALQAKQYIEAAKSAANLLETLATIKNEFALNYRRLVNSAKLTGARLLVCTIYDSIPNLPNTDRTALSVFNDVILREAAAAGVEVIDLRQLCTEDSDYSSVSPIEPSALGGGKIAGKIVVLPIFQATDCCN
jgi:hypothetical protein